MVYLKNKNITEENKRRIVEIAKVWSERVESSDIY